MFKLKDFLIELTYSIMFGRTPTQYKERARDITVKLKTITPTGRYFYQTFTRSNGHVHEQIIKPLPGKPLKSIRDNAIVICNCENHQYENEWVLWKSNSSNMVQGNGNPPRIRNPKRITKLCKHLVAVMEDFKKRNR